MIEIRNECVDCGQPCLGNSCPHRRVAYKVCDICDNEEDVLYQYGSTQYCKDCLIESLLQDGEIEEVEVTDEDYY